MAQSLMLDNGAFSAWRRQHVVDWSAYHRWADRWLDRPTTWAVVPDVIDGTEAEQDRLLAEWPHGQRGAPVWHLNESIERMLRLLDRWPRVCFGSAGAYRVVGSPSWHRRMVEAWDAIATRHTRPPVVHMLRGMQAVRWPYPFASVDSTDIGRNHNRPTNTPAGMAARWDARQCGPRWSGPVQRELI